jgi:hypothetical protein
VQDSVTYPTAVANVHRHLLRQINEDSPGNARYRRLAQEELFPVRLAVAHPDATVSSGG